MNCLALKKLILRYQLFGTEKFNTCPLSIYRHATASGGCKRLNSREWSSTDSSGYVSEDGSRLRRSVMAKSNSYGGKPTIHLTPNLRTCSLSKAGTFHWLNTSLNHSRYPSALLLLSPLPTPAYWFGTS